MQERSLRHLFSLLAVICFLQGCSTMGLAASEVVPPEGTGLIKRTEDVSKAMTAATTVTAAQVVEQGYTDVSNNCEVYFSQLIKAQNNVKLTNADLTSLGTAAAVISTLTGASQKVIGGTAALFGLATSLTSNYEQYAFATPYAAQTHRLVTKALAAYIAAAPPPANIEQAISLVSGYARLCSYAGITDLAQQAITAANPEDVNATAPLFSASDRTQYLKLVDTALGKPGLALADKDYVILAVMADPGTPGDSLKGLENLLSEAVDKPAKTTVTTPAVPAGPGTAAVPAVTKLADPLKNAAIYLKALGAGNAKYASLVTALKNSQAAPAAVPVVAGGPVPAAAPVAPVLPLLRPNIQIR